jgi:vacuolar-type H+-ATPase subunit E/Vma4
LYSDTDGTQINAKILKIHNDMEYRVTILLDSDENGVQKERQTTLNRIKHANFNSGRVLRANLQDCLLRAQFVADAEAKLLELDSRLAGNPDLYNNHSPWRLKQDGKTIQETLQDALTMLQKHIWLHLHV